MRSAVPGVRDGLELLEQQPVEGRGPRSGSCQPSERLSARIVALPFTSQLPAASRWTSLWPTVAGSVVNSPTISSRMILERDQAGDVAVFVDHEREAAARALELRQLLH